MHLFFSDDDVDEYNAISKVLEKEILCLYLLLSSIVLQLLYTVCIFTVSPGEAPLTHSTFPNIKYAVL
jgi:hypothetical protein